MTMRSTYTAYFTGTDNDPKLAIIAAEREIEKATDKNERVISWSVALVPQDGEWTAFACVVFEVEERYPNG